MVWVPVTTISSSSHTPDTSGSHSPDTSSGSHTPDTPSAHSPDSPTGSHTPDAHSSDTPSGSHAPDSAHAPGDGGGTHVTDNAGTQSPDTTSVHIQDTTSAHGTDGTQHAPDGTHAPDDGTHAPDSTDGAHRDSGDSTQHTPEDGSHRDADGGAHRDSEDGSHRDNEDGSHRDTDDGTHRDTEDGTHRDSEDGSRRNNEDSSQRDSEDGTRRDSDDDTHHSPENEENAHAPGGNAQDSTPGEKPLKDMDANEVSDLIKRSELLDGHPEIRNNLERILNNRDPYAYNADGSIKTNPDGSYVELEWDNQNNRIKGFYGEILADVYYHDRGYVRISKPYPLSEGFDSVGHHGIDGIYYKEGGHPPYIISEAKHTDSGRSPRLGKPHGGRQMSKEWLEERLADALGDSDAGRAHYKVLNDIFSSEDPSRSAKDALSLELTHTSGSYGDGGLKVKELSFEGRIVRKRVIPETA